ncbi:MAG: tetratricopeptide repeat protein [Siculibacillus sp.]|nr:tetratricopeptide repeat protein [Siculibacillus sp.]
MADIFNEIDEELRNEQIRKLWDRYGVLVLAAAVAIVVVVAGWRGYEYWRTIQSRAQGDVFTAATRLARGGDLDGAAEKLRGLAETGSGGYPTLSALRAAGILADKGEEAAAIAAFDAIAAKPATPPVLADVARVRAAYLALDLEDRPAVEARAAPLALAGKPFRHSAREILAVAAWKAGDAAATTKWIESVEADPETPRDLADRIAVLSALVRGSTATGKAE